MFSTTLLFRGSLCIVLASFEFLACLTPKLLKEQSEFLYNAFRSFCTGLVIAQSFAGIISAGGFQKEEDPRVSFALFSIVFVSLLATNNYVRLLQYSPYNALASAPTDDDEDLGIQLSSNFRAVDAEDPDGNDSDEEEVALQTSQPKTMNSLVWLYSCFVALSCLEIVKGILIGSEEHQDVKILQYIVVEGIFNCFVFGILSEEALTDPQQYVRNILMLVLSMPLGIFLGLSVPFNSATIKFIVPKMYSLASGAIGAVAVGYMLSEDIQQGIQQLSSREQDQSEYLWKIRSKVLAFVVGYIFASVILLTA